MKCPACKNTLEQMKVGNIVVDVCNHGCGGLWFDSAELRQVDEKHEAAGEALLNVKRNPDVFELIRGRTATSLACLTEILAVSPKLTSGYHRDLQLIKAPLFRAIDLAGEVLSVLAESLPSIRFVPDNIRMESSLYATEDAYRMVVEEDLPFREAYRKVGRRYSGKD